MLPQESNHGDLVQKSLPTLKFKGVVIKFNASFIFHFFLNFVPQSPGTINQDFPKSNISYTEMFEKKGQSKHTQNLWIFLMIIYIWISIAMQIFVLRGPLSIKIQTYFCCYRYLSWNIMSWTQFEYKLDVASFPVRAMLWSFDTKKTPLTENVKKMSNGLKLSP